MKYLLKEDSRSQLISKGKFGAKEKTDGKTRYQKRVKSKFANNVRNYNKIDMNKLFKDNILTVNIEVHGETDDYITTISFGGFLDILRDNLERHNNQLDLRTIIRSLIQAFNSDNVYLRCSCLHPDTKIKLLDGTSPTVEEMKLRFDKGESLYTYSVDEKGDFKPGKVKNVWITEATKEFIKITLDNDKEILTTPDHLYMLRDGSYDQAQNLKVNQFLSCSRVIFKIEKISFESSIHVYDIEIENFHNFLVDSGVILHNCPDFFYRFGYWCSKTDIIEGEKQNIPSNITNPHNTLGPGCKHLMLVLANTGWLIKVASVINNYIQYMAKYREQQYAKIIYPAIYGKKYEEPVQINIFGDDEVETDTEFIDRSNEEGRIRGRFSSTHQPARRSSTNKNKINTPEGEEEN